MTLPPWHYKKNFKLKLYIFFFFFCFFACSVQQPVAKSRPQPQVLVPLRGPAVSGFASQPSATSKIQQVQQRATILTGSVKNGQAFVSSTCQRKPETQSASSPSTPENLQPAPVQNCKHLLVVVDKIRFVFVLFF